MKNRDCRVARSFVAPLATAIIFALLSAPVHAACVTSVPGTTVCDTSAPNPWTTRVGEGNTPAGDNRTVDVLSGASIAVGNDNAISLRDVASIFVRSGAVVSATATSTAGQYGTGGNTIEFRRDGTLTIEKGGQVLALGTQGSAEAVNFQGMGNVIINNGTILAKNAVAIWSQNTTGLNAVINTETGIIEAGNGVTSQVIGGSGSGALDFTNKGIVKGTISLAGGNDILRLFTGSTVTGNFSGGAGNDTIFLSGDGTATLPGNLVGFETLIKNDPGSWTLTGNVTGLILAEVQQGILAVGDPTHPGASLTAAKIMVAPGGTLGGYGSVTGPVTNDGTIAVANALALFADGPTGTFTIKGDLVSSGVLDLAGSSVGNILTVAGNFVGQGGVMNINSVLGADESPADKLVVSGVGATASGTTSIAVSNVSGPGALTVVDGIQVVQAADGATTQPGAFMLAGPVAAGPFE